MLGVLVGLSVILVAVPADARNEPNTVVRQILEKYSRVDPGLLTVTEYQVRGYGALLGGTPGNIKLVPWNPLEPVPMHGGGGSDCTAISPVAANGIYFAASPTGNNAPACPYQIHTEGISNFDLLTVGSLGPLAFGGVDALDYATFSYWIAGCTAAGVANGAPSAPALVAPPILCFVASFGIPAETYTLWDSFVYHVTGPVGITAASMDH